MTCFRLGRRLGLSVGDAGDDNGGSSPVTDITTNLAEHVRRERRRRGYRFRIYTCYSTGDSCSMSSSSNNSSISCGRRGSDSDRDIDIESNGSSGGSSGNGPWPARPLALPPWNSAPPPEVLFSRPPPCPHSTPAPHTGHRLSLPAPPFGNAAAAADDAVLSAWASAISAEAVADSHVSCRRCRGRGGIADADTLMRGASWPARGVLQPFVVGAAPETSTAMAPSTASGAPTTSVVTATASAAVKVAGTTTMAATVAAAATSARDDANLRDDYARDYECSGCADDDHTIVTPEELADLFKRVAAAAAAAPQVPAYPFDVISMVSWVLTRVRSATAA